MTIGLVGRKCGMTRIFDDKGSATAVSVVEVYPSKVAQIKTVDSDGYQAVQVAYGSRKASKLSKAQKGHLAKAGVEAAKGLIEYRMPSVEGLNLGDEIKLDVINADSLVDVTGVSKGKGFAGVVKRHNFAMQDATHGNSLSHRAHGSIGQNQSPGKVFKGKKMAGQMGNKRVTTHNLSIVKVDEERNLLFIRGAIPGSNGGDVMVRKAVKASEEGVK